MIQTIIGVYKIKGLRLEHGIQLLAIALLWYDRRGDIVFLLKLNVDFS